MRYFRNLIIFTLFYPLSAAALETTETSINSKENTEVFSCRLIDGNFFQARHPNHTDPYFSYQEHKVTISIEGSKKSSLWSEEALPKSWTPDLQEKWLEDHRKEMILFFLKTPEGVQKCLGFFWTGLGGSIRFKGIPDEAVQNSFKQLLNIDF